MSAPGLRPLRIGEILDASIKVYKSNARTLIGLAAVVIVPLQVLSGLVLLSIVPSSADLPRGYSAITNPQPAPDPAASSGASLTIALFGIIAGLLVTASCTKAVSDVYLDQPTGFRPALGFAARRLLSLLWLEILLGVLIALGFIALIVPGVYLYVAWAVSTPVLLIEGLRGGKALKRSRQLVAGRWWPTAGLLFIVTLLVGIVSGIFQGVLLAIFLSTSDSVLVGVVLVTLASAVSAVLLQPFQAAVRTLLYYDLRVRKEGYDVELLAEQLGIEPAALPGPGYLGPESVGRPGGPPFWPPPPGWTPATDEPSAAPTAVATPPADNPSAAPTAVADPPADNPSTAPTAVADPPAEDPSAAPTAVADPPAEDPSAAPTTVADPAADDPSAAPTTVADPPVDRPGSVQIADDEPDAPSPFGGKDDPEPPNPFG